MVVCYRCRHYEVKDVEGGVVYRIEEDGIKIQLASDQTVAVDYDCPTCIEDKEVRDADFEKHYEEQLAIGAECNA